MNPILERMRSAIERDLADVLAYELEATKAAGCYVVLVSETDLADDGAQLRFWGHTFPKCAAARDSGPSVAREIILPPTSGSGRVPFVHGLADSGATIGAPTWVRNNVRPYTTQEKTGTKQRVYLSAFAGWRSVTARNHAC